ncbi:response regulator transcription factor [Nonomuraea deserti]|uniref:Response regulator transcription factor n=1 Tax=Nonomuraea deserti TaxID=1848322 RepID=A0A4R4UQM6_9ACTN|nr:response regulator transcription factor [Nonomuraea deserti]TDC90803.1 response regulator transcription factor [Nonomuraea deserti]
MLRVLVVDDQPLVRVGLIALVRNAPAMKVAGQAASGEECVQVSGTAEPDVIVMAARMPGMGGIAAAERVQAADHRPAVLLLTEVDSCADAQAALLAGASGLLPRDTPPERLLAAVRAVADGEVVLSPALARRLVERAGPVAGVTPAFACLTAREHEVLRLTGQGLSNRVMAGRLGVSEATVKTHLNRLMAKLELSSRAEVVVLAYESGLVVPAYRAGWSERVPPKLRRSTAVG